jgi:hypothetical protein
MIVKPTNPAPTAAQPSIRESPLLAPLLVSLEGDALPELLVPLEPLVVDDEPVVCVALDPVPEAVDAFPLAPDAAVVDKLVSSPSESVSVMGM